MGASKTSLSVIKRGQGTRCWLLCVWHWETSAFKTRLNVEKIKVNVVYSHTIPLAAPHIHGSGQERSLKWDKIMREEKAAGGGVRRAGMTRGKVGRRMKTDTRVTITHFPHPVSHPTWKTHSFQDIRIYAYIFPKKWQYSCSNFCLYNVCMCIHNI